MKKDNSILREIRKGYLTKITPGFSSVVKKSKPIKNVIIIHIGM